MILKALKQYIKDLIDWTIRIVILCGFGWATILAVSWLADNYVFR